jgi:hypothetical protein
MVLRRNSKVGFQVIVMPVEGDGGRIVPPGARSHLVLACFVQVLGRFVQAHLMRVDQRPVWRMVPPRPGTLRWLPCVDVAPL